LGCHPKLFSFDESINFLGEPFGLEASNVKVEKIPLVLTPVINLAKIGKLVFSLILCLVP
jgi:hypothetical protein